MSGARAITIRQPVVAGRFYEADAHRCAAAAMACCRAYEGELPERLVGGIVPHAGWICSGAIAGKVWATLAARSKPTTIVLAGSVHTVNLNRPALDEAQAWQTPLGRVEVDTTLRAAIGRLDDFEFEHTAHAHEHALEVQLPMIQQTFGEGVRIVPCMIPPVNAAPQWGEALGELLRDWSERVLVVASSDLTHYGPNYAFAPQGPGERGRTWAHQVNDPRLLDLVDAMAADRIVEETTEHHNACGGGAIAAVLAAAKAMGATRSCLLEHTNSTAVLEPLGYGDPDNSVGYAGVVF